VFFVLLVVGGGFLLWCGVGWVVLMADPLQARNPPPPTHTQLDANNQMRSQIRGALFRSIFGGKVTNSQLTTRNLLWKLTEFTLQPKCRADF